jgi:hypothetical protein
LGIVILSDSFTHFHLQLSSPLLHSHTFISVSIQLLSNLHFDMDLRKGPNYKTFTNLLNEQSPQHLETFVGAGQLFFNGLSFMHIAERKFLLISVS